MVKYQFIIELPPPGVRVRNIIKVAAAIKGPNGISPFAFILKIEIPIINIPESIINRFEADKITEQYLELIKY